MMPSFSPYWQTVKGTKGVGTMLLKSLTGIPTETNERAAKRANLHSQTYSSSFKDYYGSFYTIKVPGTVVSCIKPNGNPFWFNIFKTAEQIFCQSLWDLDYSKIIHSAGACSHHTPKTSYENKNNRINSNSKSFAVKLYLCQTPIFWQIFWKAFHDLWNAINCLSQLYLLHSIFQMGRRTKLIWKTVFTKD